MNAPTEPVVYLWVSIGDRGQPPSRVQVETCIDCGCLVRVDRFHRHGLWHRNLARLVGEL